MKPLKALITIVILLVSLASCQNLNLFLAHASVVSDTGQFSTPTMRSFTHLAEYYIRQHSSVLLAIAALISLWLFHRLLYFAAQRKKPIKLDKEDLALLGLAADSLADLWHRIQAKTKAKIIPFPRGD